MKNKRPQSLWRWICMRILTLAIGTVILIASCMWLRYAVQNTWIIHSMPEALREEFLALRQHPETDLARFHEIIDVWWGISYSDTSIASADWLMVGILVVVMIPFIVYFGLRHARPLSVQFSQLRKAADAVTGGQFGATAKLVPQAPAELVHFARDFNSMTQQLALYERELRASHVAMAHELRSPLTAAVGRLQGILDGVFVADERQLGMVMNQLRHLSRLIDELHLLSLADAGQLRLDVSQINLTELLRERVTWIKPQTEAIGMNVTLTAPESCMVSADPFRLGQVFTILMENTLRYAHPGGGLSVVVNAGTDGYRIDFQDDGPGVPADFLSEMFERFTRGESSRARHSGGSGLGLSIARAICQAHGGHISAALPASGGLLIRIQLPPATQQQR